MIKKIKLIVLIICALAINYNGFGQQKAKFAHLNSSDLMQVMPGRDTAQQVLQNLQTQLEEELKTIEAELIASSGGIVNARGLETGSILEQIQAYEELEKARKEALKAEISANVYAQIGRAHV